MSSPILNTQALTAMQPACAKGLILELYIGCQSMYSILVESQYILFINYLMKVLKIVHWFDGALEHP